VFGSGNAILWAGRARSRSRRPPDAAATLGGLLATEGYAVVRRSRRSARAQAYWLQRFSALDVFGQRPTNLRDKPALIFGISEGSRGELGGAQIEVGAREPRVLAQCIARRGRLI